MVINFLQETLTALDVSEVSPADIEWIGTKEYYMNWPEFVCIANIDYDPTQPLIQEDLRIVGRDWWLEREIRSGYYRWVFCQRREKPKKHAVGIIEGEQFLWNTGVPLVRFKLAKALQEALTYTPNL